MTELDTFLEMLSSPNWYIRQEAIGKLEGFEDERAVQALTKMLRDPEIPVRISAVEALQSSSPLSVVPDLIVALNDKAIFGYVVYTLYEIAVANNIEPPGIRELLKSSDPFLRIAGAYVLGERGGIEAIPGLIDLVRIGISGDRHEFEYAVRFLTAIGTPVVPAMIELFNKQDEGLTRMAIEVLGEVRDTRPIPQLRHILENSENEGYVRAEAAWALTEIGTPEALEAVAKWKQTNR